MGISIGQDRVRIGTQLCTNEKLPDLFARDSLCRIMLMLFCVSPSHPNLESFDCFSATQIPILDLTCMYYLAYSVCHHNIQN